MKDGGGREGGMEGGGRKGGREERRKEERRERSRKFKWLSVANIHHMHNPGASKFEGYNIQNKHQIISSHMTSSQSDFLTHHIWLCSKEALYTDNRCTIKLASFPGPPSPSFPSLAVRLSKRWEAGKRPENEATVKLQPLEVSTIHSFCLYS